MTFESDIKDLVVSVYKYILEYPSQLKIDLFEGSRVTVVTISAHKDDLGRVIGRKGQNVNSVKTFLDSYSIAKGDTRKFYVEAKTSEDITPNVEKSII